MEPNDHHRHQLQQPAIVVLNDNVLLPREYSPLEKLFIVLIGIFVIEVLAASGFYILLIMFMAYHNQLIMVTLTSLATSGLIAIPVIAIIKRHAIIIYIFISIIAMICILLVMDFINRTGSLPRHFDDCLFFVQYLTTIVIGYKVAREYQTNSTLKEIRMSEVIVSDSQCPTNITANVFDTDDEKEFDARSVTELIVK